MAKKLANLALKLLLLNLVSVFIMLFLIMPSQSPVYLWCVTGVMTLVLYFFVWRDAESAGQKDAHNDRLLAKRSSEENSPATPEKPSHKKWFGFAAGILAHIPAIVLLLGALVLSGLPEIRTLLIWLTKMWLITCYEPLFGNIFMDNYLPLIMLLDMALFSVVAGLAYLHGPAVDRKVETIIERNKAKKPMRMQDEWALEKKRKARRGIK